MLLDGEAREEVDLSLPGGNGREPVEISLSKSLSR